MSAATESGTDRHRDRHLVMRSGWVHFLRELEPERPRLFRYCRKLSGNVWDAEDLVQDTMLKAFGSIAILDDDPISWGAYMARIASNLWIDQRRRSQPLRLDEVPEPSTPPRGDSSAAIGDGGRILMTRLSPQERCAIVMKEVFEFSIAERRVCSKRLRARSRPPCIAAVRSSPIPHHRPAPFLPTPWSRDSSTRSTPPTSKRSRRRC